MNQLISLKKTDGSGEYLRIIRWIASLSHSECMDFAHLLLVDPVKVRTHQKLSNSDEFVRAVLEDWLSRGDGSRAVPRTWTALADCMEAAGLPGDLVKAVRDTFSSGLYTLILVHSVIIWKQCIYQLAGCLILHAMARIKYTEILTPRNYALSVKIFIFTELNILLCLSSSAIRYIYTNGRS